MRDRSRLNDHWSRVGPPTGKFAIQYALARQLRHLRPGTDSERHSGFIDRFLAIRVPATLGPKERCLTTVLPPMVTIDAAFNSSTT